MGRDVALDPDTMRHPTAPAMPVGREVASELEPDAVTVSHPTVRANGRGTKSRDVAMDSGMLAAIEAWTRAAAQGTAGFLSQCDGVPA